MCFRLGFAVIAATLLVGCDGCGTSLGLGATGARPYVRCLAAADPAARALTVGGLRVAVAGRELRVEGAALPLRIGAFAGAGFADPPKQVAALDALAHSGVRLLFVLGSLGDTADRAKLTAARLAGLGIPVMFVAGGRDARDRFVPALAAHASLFDATSLDRVRIGSDTFIPLAGSTDGRYALDDESCGFGLPDLKDRAARLGPAVAGERRWLLSWEAPAGVLTRDPVEVGNPDLAELATRIGAAGGLFGWPELWVGRAVSGGGGALGDTAVPDFNLVVPRAWGPWQERADGERIEPGLAMLELSEAGLRLVAPGKAQ